ncbi:TAXI family TRAP transporter solute-binding subunit [Alkalihalobacterium sp. APHAB7]|uniref:TAXI family TRAP transporter solute-binding subunit n=1 Tax=Alkalihalobacterium sp. APHAB7 TaxID=3402081 RepID=UPI003AAF2C9E
MKKVWICVCLLSIVIIMAGCGNSGDEVRQVDQVSLQVTSSGSDYFIASGLAKLASDQDLPLRITIQEVGGHVEGFRRVGQKNADFALGTSVNAILAYEGRANFEGEDLTDLRAVLGAPSQIMQFIVRANSGIDTIDDFTGKIRIASFQGTGMLVIEDVLELYGMKKDVDYTLETLTAQEMADQMADGNIDMFVTWTSVPSPVYSNLDTTTPIKILPLKEEVLDLMFDKWDPTGFPVTIKAGEYNGQTKDVLTTGGGKVFLTNKEVDDETVYYFTKLLLENVEQLSEYHPTASEISMENALRGVNLPLHPGAEKYLKEIGVIEE